MAAEPITELLDRLRDGDSAALTELSPIVYDELHRLAEAYMRRERPGHTLQPTALVHEAWMRLVAGSHPEYASRSHFFAVAAHLMRQILVDYARKRQAGKRGAGLADIRLSDGLDFSREQAGLVVALDDAMLGLSAKDALKARLVEMHFFGGLTLEEMAETEAVSMHVVRRELRMAQAWLHREISGEAAR